MKGYYSYMKEWLISKYIHPTLISADALDDVLFGSTKVSHAESHEFVLQSIFIFCHVIVAASNSLIIEGSHDVAGDIYVSGSKNAGLALMAAALLSSGKSTLQQVPSVSDVENIGIILCALGAKLTGESESLQIDTTSLSSRHVPERLTRPLRASLLILGPILARFKSVSLGIPGGCAIGTRPIDEHINGLELMGACAKLTDKGIEAHTPSGLHSAVISLQSPSVTGTMNVMMAACLANGETHIYNAAHELEATGG
ncbi:UDP-N-acetylglucosamine 1-carboxyvinyltransferase [Cladobotryum mycophilum]|uniref:UDP-N-acetylglucosamine 1-carboxyvinyltransferase n=1 Tax=Cladobotryum mycophilum TaxID=491253 RepID=A0ABR0S8T6_9HYPO